MGISVGELTGTVELDDQLSSALELLSGKVTAFAEGFDGAFGAIALGATAAIAAIGGVTAAVIALGSRGADVNDVADTLEHFAGSAGNANDIMTKLRAGTLDTVDDFALMKDASHLLSAGVKLNAADFGTLGAAAFAMQNRGLGPTKDMMGLLSDAMVTGRTRALAMKLGVVGVKDSEEEYALSLGTTKDKLTDNERAIAHRMAVMELANKVVKDSGAAHRDFGEQLEFVKAKFMNWTDDLGRAIAKSPAVMQSLRLLGQAFTDAFGGKGASSIEVITGWVNTFADKVSTYGPRIIQWTKDTLVGIRDLTNYVISTYDAIPSWIKALGVAAIAVWGLNAALTALIALQSTSWIMTLGAAFTVVTWPLKLFISQISIFGLEAAPMAATATLVWTKMLGGLATMLGTLEASPLVLITGVMIQLGGLVTYHIELWRALTKAIHEGPTAAVKLLWEDFKSFNAWLILRPVEWAKSWFSAADQVSNKLNGLGAHRGDIRLDAPVATPPPPPPPPDRDATDLKKLLDSINGADVQKKLDDLNKVISRTGTLAGMSDVQVAALAKQIEGLAAQGGKLSPLESAVVSTASAWEREHTIQTLAIKDWIDGIDTALKISKDNESALKQLKDAAADQDAHRTKNIFDYQKFQTDQYYDNMARQLRESGGMTLEVEHRIAQQRQEAHTHDIANANKRMAVWSDVYREEDIIHDMTMAALEEESKKRQEQITQITAIGDGLQNLGQTMGGVSGAVVVAFGRMFTSISSTLQLLDRFKTSKAHGGAGANVTGAEQIGLAFSGASAFAGIGTSVASGALQGAMGGLAIGSAAAMAASTSLSIAAGAATMGIGLVAGALIAWGKASAAKAKQDRANAADMDTLKQSIADIYGTYAEATAMANKFGLALENPVGHSANDLANLKNEVQAFNDKMAALTSAVSKYGLTWDDMPKAADRLDAVQKAAKSLTDTVKLLTQAGYSNAAIVKGMSGDLNDWLNQALKAGVKIPAAMQPIIEQLIRTKGLTEANARALLGLAEDGMPSLDDIAAAANRYGLELKDLGPKVQQLSISAQAGQIVTDFNMLTAAGVPFSTLMKDIPVDITDAAGNVSTVMTGMHAQLQGLVTDALNTGLTLPESMKPILQTMIDGGYLTDQFGEKLLDTSKLNFAKPLAEMFDTLIAKLDELIDKIAGPKGVAGQMDYGFGQAGKAAENARDRIVRAGGDAEAAWFWTPGHVGGAPPMENAARAASSLSARQIVQHINVRVSERTILSAVVRGAPDRLELAGV